MSNSQIVAPMPLPPMSNPESLGEVSNVTILMAGASNTTQNNQQTVKAETWHPSAKRGRGSNSNRKDERKVGADKSPTKKPAPNPRLPEKKMRESDKR